MGATLAGAFLQSGLVEAGQLTIVELDGAKRKRLEDNLGVDTKESLEEWDGVAENLLLAVKPQDAQKACKSLMGRLSQDTLIISVMAGIKIMTLSDLCGGHKLFIRVMPNLPAKVGEGVSVFVPAKGVSEDKIRIVEGLLKATGICLRVDDEALLDAATAISGSGPGYVFYMIEQFIEGATELGFSNEQAQELVRYTFRGALKLWEKSGESAQALRKAVSSKGGTTEAAMRVFEHLQMGDTFKKGIHAAFRRAKEL